MSLTFDSRTKNNGLIIFDALATGEMQTGRRLNEDVLDATQALGRNGYCTYYKITSKQMLVSALQLTLIECGVGVLFPILHFECHGDREKGIYLHACDEYVGWPELIEHIGAINKACDNNAAVVLATCYGFEISKHVAFMKPCPFNFVIAPQNEVDAGQLRDLLPGFYSRIATSGDLGSGVRDLDPALEFFHCGKWFYTCLGSYLARMNSKERQRMAETMVTYRRGKIGELTPEGIRATRANAKSVMTDLEGFYLEAASTFFHGAVPITYEDFIASVERFKRRT